jgi:tetraacyldisaccharide 4'-kinase
MADGFIVIGGSVPSEVAASGKPVFTATLETDWRPAPGTSYFAFSGLGRPEKFFQTVRAQGADLKEVCAFPDHHAYSTGDIDALNAMAAAFGAKLVTTEKDAVRLPPGTDADIVPVALRFADEAALLSFLKTRLAVQA